MRNNLQFSFPIFIILFLTPFSVSFSQDYSYLDSLDGKFALQFQITQNLTLTDFQGAIFSGKYHFSKRDAIRLGLTLEFGNSEYETEVTSSDTLENSSNEDYTSLSLSISTQYIRYIAVTEDIAFYMGAGPFFGIFNSSSERVINYEGTEILREAEEDGYSIGVDALTGVEWWFHEQMSLSAEYGIKFSYISREEKFKDDISQGELNMNSFYITDNHVKFGLSIYF